jgi:drug/metabolite transporter (DMT)-like permease
MPPALFSSWSLAPGAFGTGIAVALIAVAPGRFGASRVSGTAFLIPVVALALGMFVLHEQVAPLSIAGGFVCLLGAWLMKRADSH